LQALDLWRGPRSPTSAIPAAGAEIARPTICAIAIEEPADASPALGSNTLAVDLVTAALDEFGCANGSARADASVLTGGVVAEALRAYASRAALDEDPGSRRARAPAPGEDVLLVTASTSLPAARHPPMTQARADARSSAGESRSACFSTHWGAERPSQLIPFRRPGSARRSLRSFALAIAPWRRALVGHCDPEPTTDYQPVAEILRSLVEALILSRVDAPFGFPGALI
jgi:hypothetical protein